MNLPSAAFSEAESFLTFLDEDESQFTFQCFDDLKTRGDKILTKIRNGTLEQHWKELCELNSLGAGIFVTVNKTDLNGRKISNIQRVRAVWQEVDRGDEPALPCTAHIEVQTSPGRYHRYFLVDGLPLGEFSSIQERLVQSYGSDPSARDLARVLRLPGFYHVKDPTRPFPVKVTHTSGEPPFTAERLKELFPPLRGKRERPFKGSRSVPFDSTRVMSALSFIDPDCDYVTWMQVLMALHSTGAAGALDAALEWSRKGVKYHEGEVEYRFNSFRREGIGLGTLFHLAISGGWIEPAPKYREEDLLPEPPMEEPVSFPPSGFMISEGDPATEGSEAVVVCYANVAPEPIHWLWPDRIARGKLTLLAGDPGLGKSLLTLGIAAHVSLGAPWPVDHTACRPGDTLLLSAEDDLSDTIRPRLDAAGADVRRVYGLKMIRTVDRSGRDKLRTFSLSRDIALLDKELSNKPNCRLIVIDPVTAYLDGTDSHNNADIRGLLAPLSELAARHKVAVLAVTHLNKSAAASSMYRAMGSLAFVAAARAVWAVTKDKDNPSRYLLLPIKNNLAQTTTGLAYAIATADNGSPVITWEDQPVTISVDEALSPEAMDQERSELDEAKDWLLDMLSGGPVETATITKRAKLAGFSWGTVRRAYSKLKARASKDGYQGAWCWSLPPPNTVCAPLTGPAPDKDSSKDAHCAPLTKTAPQEAVRPVPKPSSGATLSKDAHCAPLTEVAPYAGPVKGAQLDISGASCINNFGDLLDWAEEKLNAKDCFSFASLSTVVSTGEGLSKSAKLDLKDALNLSTRKTEHGIEWYRSSP